MLRSKQSLVELPAQILIVTLLTLVIVAVVVVGVVATANRDVEQTVSNQKYQQVYNSGETTILRLIDKYGNPAVSLAELPEDFPQSNCVSGMLDEYSCEFIDSEGVVTELVIDETNVIEGYELRKDDSFMLRLDGYRGNIVVDWRDGAALEFTLFYSEGDETKTIQDLFDDPTNPVFDSAGDNPYNVGSSQHPFNFQPDPQGAKLTFNIDGIAGLPLAGANTMYMRITARFPTGQEPVYLDISGVGLPDQVRQFTATSYDPNSDIDTVAVVVTHIPLVPPIAAIFNYGLSTPGLFEVKAPIAGN